MAIQTDRDVEAVVEFMTRTIPASRLVAVAGAVSALAPSLWGQYESERIQPLRLVTEPIPGGQRTRSTASEFGPAPACADGDSVVVGAGLR